MKSSKPIEELMADKRLLTREKIEVYLLVHLGLKPCSQMTLPAELPGAEAMGSTIDRTVYPKMSRIRAEAEPRRRLAAIGALK